MAMRRIIVLCSILLLLVPFTAVAQDFCEGNFDYDQDQDGGDAFTFKTDFGRSQFSNPCPPDGPAPVAKTGQTESDASGDDGDLEKGVVWPNPRFTDNGNGTVADNLTGLIWLKNANCFYNGHWSEALSEANGLNNGECGLTDGSSSGDWRLPNRNELNSLIDVRYFNPAIPNTAGTGQLAAGDPFDNVQPFGYWTSTKLVDSSFDGVWYISPFDGGVYYEEKALRRYIWPVRGGH